MQDLPNRERVLRNERTLHALAQEHGCHVAPFPAEVVTDPGSWKDACHLDERGCREKAEHVAPFVRELLER